MFSCSVIIGRSASVQCKVLGLVSLSENPTAQIQIYAFFIFFCFAVGCPEGFWCNLQLVLWWWSGVPLWNLEDVWFVHALKERLQCTPGHMSDIVTSVDHYWSLTQSFESHWLIDMSELPWHWLRSGFALLFGILHSYLPQAHKW